jgi:hypothetical protein
MLIPSADLPASAHEGDIAGVVPTSLVDTWAELSS